MNTVLYHGSTEIVRQPEIRKTKYNKDFYFGFYCTRYEEQAIRWATRFGHGVVNLYQYTENEALKVKIFPDMTEEWLDFIVSCRLGNPHVFDIVEGPMANDRIFNYVQNLVDGVISRQAFWELVKFNRPTHQISFHTPVALQTITFSDSREVG